MATSSNDAVQTVDCELGMDELDSVAAGSPVTYKDGILAIGIPGVAGIFIGDGCIGGWLGKTAVAIC